MEVDPHHVFAYWEITPEDERKAVQGATRGGGEARWVLRFYDITFIHFDGTNSHGSFDLPIDPGAGNWYVDLWSDEKSYCAEIGLAGADGRFAPVARSNVVHTPRSSASARYDPRFTRVEPERPDPTVMREPAPPPQEPARMSRKSSPAPAGWAGTGVPGWGLGPGGVPPGSPPEMAFRASDRAEGRGGEAPQGSWGPSAGSGPIGEEEIRRHYEELSEASGRPGASSGAPGGSPAPGGDPGRLASAWLEGGPSGESSFGLSSALWAGAQKPSISLEIGADLVIYGKAQPGQTLQVNGESVTVNPDGTFRVHLTLAKPRDKE
jgi:hypothetical protein